MTNSKGESTNALFGFIRSILKLIKDFNPTYLVSVFDGPHNGKKRTALYADYKAHRKEMPQDLLYQIHWAKQFCQLMGIPELMIPEVEADDTMGTIALWAAKHHSEAYLCTSDKDMCQLVNKHTFILNTFKDNLILDAAGVEEQFGVRPDQMIDYLAINGDASDNVPGLSGFGPKTASALLQKFGTLDYILEHPDEAASGKKKETLIQEREKVLLSRQLVTIDIQVPIPENSDFYLLTPPQLAELREFYHYMNFSSLLRELEAAPSKGQEQEPQHEEMIAYQLVDTQEDFNRLIELLTEEAEICIDTETTDTHPMRAELVGIGLGVEPGKAWYIPVNGQLGLEHVLKGLKPILENPKIGFYGHNIKYDYHVLLNYNIEIANLSFDTILASYLLNSHSRQHSLDALSLDLFGKVKIPIGELIGKGKNQISMREVSIDKVCAYCCEDVDYTIRLKEKLSPQLDERGLSKLMYNLELPLLPILARMERHGIFIDRHYLNQLSTEINKEIAALAESIYEMADEVFNLNSPKQLSQVLFGKLGISPPKKIATGHSTNAEVLESLKGAYPIATKLLEYRTLEKLRSTYVETLPLQINPHTHRVHCQFNQSVAATGRLSCQDPNLQNIPVRTEIGRKIRAAFRPEKQGWSYLSADYSQIELRLLAHLSDDPMLIHAFKANEDIHTFTASQIFNVAIDQVTREQRYQAKTVNFGIMYGQQAFGLSQELGINPKAAAAFIHMYFERYGKVKEYLEKCKETTRATNKSVTLYGRERLIPEINSKNANIRMMAERLAVNTPIQGTQADLIKMAMLEIDKQLAEKKLKGYLILQIHDELLFEVPNDELEEVSLLAHQMMEGVAKLKVPLVVDISIGKNWEEC
jgi:DNA polymerase-1